MRQKYVWPASNPDKPFDVPDCAAPICVVGGFEVSAYTLYVNESPSGSEPVHVNVGDLVNPVVPFAGVLKNADGAEFAVSNVNTPELVVFLPSVALTRQ
jgi:hypothetical protein